MKEVARLHFDVVLKEDGDGNLVSSNTTLSYEVEEEVSIPTMEGLPVGSDPDFDLKRRLEFCELAREFVRAIGLVGCSPRKLVLGNW